MSPDKVDALLVFIAGQSPPKPAFHDPFNQVAVISRAYVALVSLAIIAAGILGREHEQTIRIVNFPQHVPIHLYLV